MGVFSTCGGQDSHCGGSSCCGAQALGLNSPQFSSVQLLSRVRLFATPWTGARQASLSITNSQEALIHSYTFMTRNTFRTVSARVQAISLKSFTARGVGLRDRGLTSQV